MASLILTKDAFFKQREQILQTSQKLEKGEKEKFFKEVVVSISDAIKCVDCHKFIKLLKSFRASIIKKIKTIKSTYKRRAEALNQKYQLAATLADAFSFLEEKDDENEFELA